MNHKEIIELEDHSHPDTKLGFDLVLFENNDQKYLYAFTSDPVPELECVADGYYYIGNYGNEWEMNMAITKLENELSSKYEIVVLMTGSFRDIQASRDLLLQSGIKSLHVMAVGDKYALSGRREYISLVEGLV